MMRALPVGVGFALCIVAVPAAQAQVVTSELPTPYAGDYLNGVAASDVAGGLFVAGEGARPDPAVGFSIPTAFGAQGHDLFAAVGGHIGARRGRGFRDGAVFLGTGLGDSRRLVGAEATFAIYDLIGDAFEERSLSVKVHRRLGADWAVAAGMENLLVAGRTDGGRSLYGVVSGSLFLPAQRRLTVTAGLGNGRFNFYSNVRRGRNAVGMFGGVALRFLPEASGFVSWTGQDLNAGLSFVPFPEWPFVITPVLLDVDGRGGHGARLAVSIGVGTTW